MTADDNIPWFNSQQFLQKFIASGSPLHGRTEPFRIVKIQEVIGYLKFPLPLHRTEYYDIMFISRGQSSFKHRGLKRYQVDAGQVFFKAAGQITSGDVLGKDIQGYFCLVQDEFFSNTGLIRSPLSSLPFFRYGNSPIVILTPAELERFDFLLSSMHQSYATNDQQGSRNPVIAAYLHAFLQEAALIHRTQNAENTRNSGNTGIAENPPPASTNTTTAAETLTDKFKDLVSEHYLDKQQVKEYADMLFVTPNHLNRMIRKTTGKTALDLISEMLIMEAEILLQQTDKTINEIAAYLSFEDASYFTRFFRKNKGVTPGAYRKGASPKQA